MTTERLILFCLALVNLAVILFTYNSDDKTLPIISNLVLAFVAFYFLVRKPSQEDQPHG